MTESPYTALLEESCVLCVYLMMFDILKLFVYLMMFDILNTTSTPPWESQL